MCDTQRAVISVFEGVTHESTQPSPPPPQFSLCRLYVSELGRAQCLFGKQNQIGLRPGPGGGQREESVLHVSDTPVRPLSISVAFLCIMDPPSGADMVQFCMQRVARVLTELCSDMR